MVVCAVSFPQPFGPTVIRSCGLGKTDGKSLYGILRLPGHGTNHQCGIDATAQERARGTSAISLRRTLSSNILRSSSRRPVRQSQAPRRPPPRAGSNNSVTDRARVTGQFHPRARGSALRAAGVPLKAIAKRWALLQFDMCPIRFAFEALAAGSWMEMTGHTGAIVTAVIGACPRRRSTRAPDFDAQVRLENCADVR